ncbi:hypothetical protein [Ramlibacter sp. AN1133]|uniref:hypothetical protein n=1 Tax=Ramlibacter sp. AN1133 TaxID=3133429 RepID=UPI0030C25885
MISAERSPARTAHGGSAAKLMLLRRVGGAVGDDLLAQLQPLLLLHEVLRVALARPAPDLAALRGHAQRIGPAVQCAMNAGTAAAEWLLPQAGASTPSADLAAECAALLRPEFELCGLRIELSSAGKPLPIDRDQARTMICAVLAHAGDHAGGPGAMRVRLEHHDGVCAVRVSHRPDAGAVAADFLRPRQAPMAWEDLIALAQLEHAALRRADDGAFVLELTAARTA